MWLCIPTTSFPMPSANSQSHTGVSHPIKQIPNLPGWDRALSWPCFHPSSCRSPSKTAETPSNVLNQLWETVPTTNPVEILRKRIFYRKGIMKCQMRKEIHKLITGRNNFDLSHGSSFQLKLLFLLFVETQWYWRLNQCWFWKISDFQSAHPTLIFICSVVLWENIEKKYLHFQTYVQMMSSKPYNIVRCQNTLCFVCVQRITWWLQAITILEIHWPLPWFQWRQLQQFH